MTVNKKKRRRLKIFGVILLGIAVSTPAITGLFLNDLEDVDTGTAVSCNFLHYNGTAWTDYDLWNVTAIWYSDHTFNSIVTADAFYGDGGNLTNVTGSGDGYAGSRGHPHDQDLNISSIVYFNRIYSTFFGDGGNLTNITGDGYAGSLGHPHDQDLNTSDSVIFEAITYNDGAGVFRIDALNNDLYLDVNLAKPPIQIHSTGETTEVYQSASRTRLALLQTVLPMIWTKLLTSVEDYDQNADHNPATVRFVAPLVGLYHISYSVCCETVPQGIRVGAMIYKNGVPVGGYEQQTTGWATNLLAMSGSDILLLQPNDFIELYVYNNNLPMGLIHPAFAYSNYLAICKIA